MQVNRVNVGMRLGRTLMGQNVCNNVKCVRCSINFLQEERQKGNSLTFRNFGNLFAPLVKPNYQKKEATIDREIQFIRKNISQSTLLIEPIEYISKLNFICKKIEERHGIERQKDHLSVPLTQRRHHRLLGELS